MTSGGSGVGWTIGGGMVYLQTGWTAGCKAKLEQEDCCELLEWGGL